MNQIEALTLSHGRYMLVAPPSREFSVQEVVDVYANWIVSHAEAYHGARGGGGGGGA